jgi:putative YpdA family bacillithiol system oxidoreductase
MDTLIAIVIAAVVSVFFLRGYLKSLKKRDEMARKAAEKGKLFSDGPKSQHPHIDTNYCIGCATCTTVCPEGDVLAMLAGKAVIVNGHKCIGHSLCAEACPVGAITMVMASPSMGSDMPYMTPEYETSIENLFIIGELGGLALIKNAVNQGRDCVDHILRRRAAKAQPAQSGVFDVLIVGAGPAGISASLRAIENKLNYVTLEQDEIGGTVAKYPRQKLVMTSPVEFPMYGKFKKTELSKENLLAFWDMVLNRADFNCVTQEKVEQITKGEDGMFVVKSANNQYRTRAVILALGKTGTPRKLGVPGEELPKVMYRLIEADHYVNKKILVVGGGDSAVEAAMGLAHQVGNKVTLCYRSAQFSRIKERNTKRIEECMKNGKVEVLFETNPKEIKAESVVLDVKGTLREIPNDYVWVFAGGIPPYDFLKKIGIRFGLKDITQEASSEAKQAAKEKELARTGAGA